MNDGIAKIARRALRTRPTPGFRRCEENPILIPTRGISWESYAVFNPSVVRRGRTYYMLYRAISSSEYLISKGTTISSIGIARSRDGIHFHSRRRFIYPQHEWERFGCEDPRAVYFEGKYYIFYTAISTLPPTADGIRVGVAISKDLKRVEAKYLVTPFNAKAMVLFPRRIGGKVTAVLTVHTDKPPAYIAIAELSDDPARWKEDMAEWYRSYMDHVIRPDPRRSDRDHIEVGAPPVELEDGWLLIYSYIQNYFGDPGPRIFGVEALLLDLDDPRKVLKKTTYPFMTPEEVYEIFGNVPRVVFPTSALLERNTVKLYYGAADTTCCCATVPLSTLRAMMDGGVSKVFRRHEGNPVIRPDGRYWWRSFATFNPGAIELEGKIYVFFRALSGDLTSRIGLAVTEDGLHIDRILEDPVYVPRMPFEQKRVPGLSGCEDPRLVRINDRVYMFYTAFDGMNPPRVAVTSILVNDLLSGEWNWSEPVLVSPEGIDDKNACVLPQRIDGKYFFIHRLGGINVVYDYLSSLEQVDPTELVSSKLLPARPGMWDGKKVGMSAPPIRTKEGWLMFYHGVSHDNVYRVGVALLEERRPEHVIARSVTSVLQPEEWYEREGFVNNVVFPCGAVLRDDTVYLYYGGADKHVCVATAHLDDVLSVLFPG
ncbi:MAG: hypothetical protein N3H32_00020 [Nitrososphaeria archaeon]|nr:hypothetical protein [Nitrososphaeria archaeon]MDW8043636.1 hypothetical protein [Nitrososphaerota archaeon]